MGDRINRANVTRVPRAGTRSLAIFNCMAGEMLLSIAYSIGMRVGFRLVDQYIFLQNAKRLENAKLLGLGLGGSFTDKGRQGDLVTNLVSEYARGMP